MFNRITITRQQDDLTQAEWTFWFEESDSTLFLANYTLSKRESKRHKFKPVEWYDRLDRRNNKIKNIDDVPFPNDVTAEARQQFIDKITVTLKRKGDRD